MDIQGLAINWVEEIDFETLELPAFNSPSKSKRSNVVRDIPENMEPRELVPEDIKEILFETSASNLLDRISELGNDFSLEDAVSYCVNPSRRQAFLNRFEALGLVSHTEDSTYHVTEKGRVFIINRISKKARDAFEYSDRRNVCYPVSYLLALNEGINTVRKINSIPGFFPGSNPKSEFAHLVKYCLAKVSGETFSITDVGKTYAKEIYEKIKAIEDYLGFEKKINFSDEQVNAALAVPERKTRAAIQLSRSKPLSPEQIIIVPENAIDTYNTRKGNNVTTVVLGDGHHIIVDAYQEIVAMLNAVNMLRKEFPNERLKFVQRVSDHDIGNGMKRYELNVYSGRRISTGKM